MRALSLGIATLLASGLLLACGDDPAERDADAARAAAKKKGPQGQRARDQSLNREGLGVATLDLNRDERADRWTITNGAGQLVRVEHDLNFDGNPDLWQYFDPQTSKLVEEELDLDFDFRVDLVVYYQDGVLARKDLSLAFDGQFTVAKFYDNQGELLRIEEDSDGDGKIDRWDYFEGGRRARIGWDEDKDGQPDKFDTLP